ncbi:hypothetical protein [Ahniella affigens]|uniref:hypothetical protein n=1 Tax=Ahniella affigens TaxID=2021234 RepID=UPI0011B22817|nr:hypothetical protein [Ahniella affigens]
MELVETCAIRSARVVRVQEGWVAMVYDGHQEYVLTAAQSRQPKVFKGFATAINLLQRIGVARAEVDAGHSDERDRHAIDLAQFAEHDAWFRAEVRQALEEAEEANPRWINHTTVRSDGERRQGEWCETALGLVGERDGTIQIQYIADAIMRRVQHFKDATSEDESGRLTERAIRIDLFKYGAGPDDVLKVCGSLLLDLAEMSADRSLVPTALALQRIAVAYRAEQDELEETRHLVDAEHFAYAQQVRKLCIDFFYKSTPPNVRVDMSAHREAVAAARDAGGDPKILDALDRYLDEKKALAKIYLSVREHFGINHYYATAASLPTTKEIASAAETALADVMDRAGSFVPVRIALALKRT